MVTSVLFLCRDNAGRSILAEALLNQLGKGEFAAASAGFCPAPIQPIVLDILKENYIDPAGFHSKPVSQYEDQTFDYVIALSDEDETYPESSVTATRGRFRWTFRDPAQSGGTHLEQLVAYRRLMLELRMRLSLFAIIATRPELSTAA